MYARESHLVTATTRDVADLFSFDNRTRDTQRRLSLFVSIGADYDVRGRKMSRTRATKRKKEEKRMQNAHVRLIPIETREIMIRTNNKRGRERGGGGPLINHPFGERVPP